MTLRRLQAAISLAVMVCLAPLAWDASPAAGETSPSSGPDIRLPQGPDVNLVYAKCRTCHDLQYVRDAKGLLPAQWKAVLAGMRGYGLTISAEDEAKVLDYLTTYLGPNPPPSAASPGAGPASGHAGKATGGAQQAATSGTRQNGTSAGAAPDGRQVYVENCATCHGPDGRGQQAYYPPLAGNPDLARDPLFVVQVVLHGLSGRIEVKGTTFDGAMPSFDHLSNGEIAAVVNYVRDTFAKPTKAINVEAQDIASARGKPMSPQDVHASRAAMH